MNALFAVSLITVAQSVSQEKEVVTNYLAVSVIIILIYIKKMLDSDWLRELQFKCDTSAKSVTRVQTPKQFQLRLIPN